jgi:hypothetical protein
MCRTSVMSGLRTPARLLPRKRRAAGPQYARWQGSTRFLLLPAVCTHPTQPSSPKCPLCKNFRCCPQLLQLATFSARSRGGEAPEPRFRACQTIRLPFHTKPPTDSPSVRFSPTHPPSPASEPTVRERSNVRAEWTGARGAGGAYAAAVPRVTVTLEPFVRALLRFRFRIFSPTRGHPLHCQPLVRATSAAPSPSFSGTHPRRISGAIPTLRLLKCPRPRPSSPPNQAASAARRRPRSMFNTSLSDILVCARTSAISDRHPRRGRCVRSCRAAGSRYAGLPCSAIFRFPQ